MKKLFCILLSALLILPVIALFGVGAAVESTYEELWAQKEEYEKNRGGVGIQENMWAVYYEFPWRILPYTEAGNNLTYVWEKYQEGGGYLPWELFHDWGNRTLCSPELGYALLIEDDFYFMNIEEIAKNDLTTDGFSYFLRYLRGGLGEARVW